MNREEKKQFEKFVKGTYQVEQWQPWWMPIKEKTTVAESIECLRTQNLDIQDLGMKLEETKEASAKYNMNELRLTSDDFLEEKVDP